MAFTAYHNITGSTGVNIELIAPGENSGEINTITIANKNLTSATISLFIQNDPIEGKTSTFYMLSAVAIPPGVSLLLDNKSMLSFDNSSAVGYGLYLTVGGSDALDVMINR